MSVTPSIDDPVRARFDALADAERDVEELRRLSMESDGDRRGWRFDRDEIHERGRCPCPESPPWS